MGTGATTDVVLPRVGNRIPALFIPMSKFLKIYMYICLGCNEVWSLMFILSFSFYYYYYYFYIIYNIVVKNTFFFLQLSFFLVLFDTDGNPSGTTTSIRIPHPCPLPHLTEDGAGTRLHLGGGYEDRWCIPWPPPHLVPFITLFLVVI